MLGCKGRSFHASLLINTQTSPAMFAVPGFSVGNLVVEGSKEQLKKRKADAITTPTPTTTTAAITEIGRASCRERVL